MARIELSTYVEGLRNELQRCIEMSEGKDLRFGTDKIELELEVETEIEIDSKAEAIFKFYVFNAKAQAEAAGSISHKQTLKLALLPVYRGKAGSVMIESGIKSNDHI